MYADILSYATYGYLALLHEGHCPPEIDFMKHIVRGVIPFIGLQLIGLALITIFPQLVLWLPSLLIR